MKIIQGDRVFVQKNDMAYLNSSCTSIPASVFMKVFGKGITIIDNSNRYEFIEFTEPEEIEFFEQLDWIVDYNKLKDLSEEELIEYGQSIATEKNEIARNFNAMSEKKRREQYEQVSMELELLDFKMYSIRDIIMLKRGELIFSFPEGVEVSHTLMTDQTKNDTTQKEETKIKRFIKTIFRKKQDK